jgi:hypothetical protein
MVKIGSNKRKPEVGIELTVTFSLTPDLNAEQSGDAIMKFLDGVRGLATDLGVIWLKLQLSGLPEELEPKLLEAKAAYEAQSSPIRLVIDNTR